MDTIVAVSATATRGAKQATTTIAIAMMYAGDPIGNGLVASLARPGRNVTETISLTDELNGKLEVIPTNPDLEGSFHKATKEGLDGLVIGSGPRVALHRKRIFGTCEQEPAVGNLSRFTLTNDGGLMSSAANIADQFRRAEYFVDKILKRTKPADLPVEQHTKFELVINLKATKHRPYDSAPMFWLEQIG